ncbi:hypothetical protein ABEB36_000543 [Hypothenemus hampei]|uniref:Uncharacterized protein n=1 Tax=Hypothenemus hampei TaxID=57062 RepID=A0ABD1FBK2_HYPHA
MFYPKGLTVIVLNLCFSQVLSTIYDDYAPVTIVKGPPHFTQSIYKVTLTGNNKILPADSSITIENYHDNLFVVIASENYNDYSVSIVKSNQTDQKQIQLDISSTNPINKQFDVIVLEARDEASIPISRTMVVLFNSNLAQDMYRMVFKVDNDEYIILNFYYFKWFLALLTITGLLILIVELYEIFKSIKMTRQNSPYKELQNI